MVRRRGYATRPVDAVRLSEAVMQHPEHDPTRGETGPGPAAATDDEPGAGFAPAEREDSPREAVEEPARLMRIASTVQTLLHEVQTTELDQAARERLTAIHNRIVDELGDIVSADLAQELRELSFEPGEETPTGAELRVMQAQLAGWLQGLFHGIQASIATQQIAAQQELDRRHAQQGGELPGGESGQYL